MDNSGQEWPRYGHQWTIVDRNGLNMDDCGQGMASTWSIMDRNGLVMDNYGQEWP